MSVHISIVGYLQLSARKLQIPAPPTSVTHDVAANAG